jgi:hypothetical protein
VDIRRIVVTATVMLTALGAAIIGDPRPASAASYSYLVNSEAGLCMDNYARSGEVYQYPCNPQHNQWWRWRRPAGQTTGNQWMIINDEAGYDQCLSSRGGSYYSEIILSVCNEFVPSQKWRWISWGDQWTIQNDRWGSCIGASVGPAISKLVLAECVIRPSVIWRQVDAIP